MILKQKCPNCGKMVDIVFTSHARPGTFNCCSFCATEAELSEALSLQELNEKRRNTVTHIEMFYERSFKSWAVIRRNCNGEQLGSAVYVYTKAEAKAQMKEWEERYKDCQTEVE